MTDKAWYTADRNHRIDALLYAADLIRVNGFVPSRVSADDCRMDVPDALRCTARRFTNADVALSDLHFLAAGRKAIETDAQQSWCDFTFLWSDMDAVDWLSDLADLVHEGMVA